MARSDVLACSAHYVFRESAEQRRGALSTALFLLAVQVVNGPEALPRGLEALHVLLDCLVVP